MNAHDTEVMAGIFEALGYTLADDMLKVEVILLNIGGSRRNAENKGYSEIGNLKRIKRNRPDCLNSV
ncbi:hypothetical protein [Mammaliicoccus sciuri]|uniref:hypothetical protein n=1 Tax=Mammaliicoccus sciuri TaxID=1296 RepID=UPI003F6DD27D